LQGLLLKTIHYKSLRKEERQWKQLILN
jgi:hypothetical protein